MCRFYALLSSYRSHYLHILEERQLISGLLHQDRHPLHMGCLLEYPLSKIDPLRALYRQ